ADLDSTSGRDKALEEARALIATTRERSALRIDLIRYVADRLNVPEEYATPGRSEAAAPRRTGDPGPQEPTREALERSPGDMALRPERAFIAQCLASGDLGLSYLMRLIARHLSSPHALRACAPLFEHFDDPLKDVPEDELALGRLLQAVVVEAEGLPAETDSNLHTTLLVLRRQRI